MAALDARLGLAISILALAPLPAGAQESTTSREDRPDDVPAPASDLFGRGHLYLQVDRVDFTGATQDVWGVDTDRYVGLSGFWGGASNFYVGVELGRVGVGTTRTSDDELIEDFSFYSGELNFKKLFRAAPNLGIGVGGGCAVFLAEGEQVDALGRTDLADFGFGYQGFVELDYRAGRFLIGLELKYQAAIDFLNLDYSNLRLGPRIGVVF